MDTLTGEVPVILFVPPVSLGVNFYREEIPALRENWLWMDFVVSKQIVTNSRKCKCISFLLWSILNYSQAYDNHKVLKNKLSRRNNNKCLSWVCDVNRKIRPEGHYSALLGLPHDAKQLSLMTFFYPHFTPFYTLILGVNIFASYNTLTTTLNHKTFINTSGQGFKNILCTINAAFTQDNTLTKTKVGGLCRKQTKRYMLEMYKPASIDTKDILLSDKRKFLLNISFINEIFGLTQCFPKRKNSSQLWSFF